MLPRLHDSSGVHRSPTVGLVVAGLLYGGCHVHTTDLFPLTLAGGRTVGREPVVWSSEGKRFADFIGSETQPEAVFKLVRNSRL